VDKDLKLKWSGFSVKPFIKRLVITPTTLLLLEFSVKPFFKRVEGKLFLKRVVITLGLEDKFFKFKRCLVFDHMVLQKVCSQAFFEKGCDTTATPVDRAEHIVAGVFA
jgi:hypothetical protein